MPALRDRRGQLTAEPGARPFTVSLPAVVLSLGLLLAQGASLDAQQFNGVIERELRAGVPGPLVVLTRVDAAPDGLAVPPGARLFSGALLWQPVINVLLVEPAPSADPFLFVDIDQNGSLTPNERRGLTPTRAQFGRRRARVDLGPWAGGFFRQVPFDLLLADERLPLKQRSLNERYLLQPAFLLATAKVEVENQTIYFRYGVDPASGQIIGPSSGLQSVDRGTLVTDYLSPWRAWGRGAPPVFRIGHHYLSTRSVDLDRGVVTVEARRPEDYKRLELVRGQVIPDFEFYDVENAPRRLSEFLGRYVLLNIWYAGCSPCTDEFPYLRDVLRRFAPQDLVVVGLSQSGTPAELRRLGASSEPGWVEADPRSVRAITSEWLQISSTPTAVLLDRKGRVISVNNTPRRRGSLRGAELQRTLQRIIGN